MDFICFGIDLYLLFFFWLTRRRRMWERFFPTVMSCFLFYSWCNFTLSFQCVQKLGNSEDRRWLSFPQYNSVSVYVGFILLAHSWNLIHFISLFTFNVKCLHICFRTVMAIFLINLNLRLKFVRFKLSNLFFPGQYTCFTFVNELNYQSDTCRWKCCACFSLFYIHI